jgi:hypothetical protein
MSAFIVGDEHISAMLKAANLCGPGGGRSYYWNGEGTAFLSNIQVIGQKLVDENYRSVNSRYESDNEPRQFTRKIFNRKIEPVEIIKACDCYIYQSCESPDWQESEAYAIVQVLREMAIKALPGYNEAQWEVIE